MGALSVRTAIGGARALLGSTSLTGLTVTTSQPLIDQSQTWNAGAVTFTGWKLNVTNTASGGSSMLLDLQTGGVSQFSVRRDGFVSATAGFVLPAGGNFQFSSRGVWSMPANGQYRFQNSAQNATVDLTVTNNIATFSTPVKTSALTVATLPAAATAGAGARSFVTDANATTFASIVAGGGANGVPVYSDGTNWRIG